MSLRIAFVCLHTSPLDRAGTADAGGMNVMIRALARALVRAGHRVEFFTRRSHPDQPATEIFDDLLVLNRIDAGPPAVLPKSEIDQYIDEFRTNLGTLRGFDVVHSHHWMSGVAALPLAREAGIPHVMTFHSVAAHPNSPLHDGEPPESPARVPGEVLCAEQSDLVIAVSKYEAAVTIGRCNADPEKVAIVRPGVNTELFRPALREEQGWTPEPGIRAGYVLFAARLQPLKAPDLAIRTLAEVPEAIRPDLVIVGQTSPDFAGYEDELHRLVDELGLTETVRFLPGRDRPELAKVIRHASVMLVPSFSETFGLIALEASASGVPVLAAAAGGLTEAICNTHTGLLIPTRDAAVWGQELTGLLTDDERRALMGATGRQRAEDMTWPKVAERTTAAYRRAIGARLTRRVCFVHAHPDDETLASGALIAHLADEGIHVSVLTATRGEMGEVVPGPLSHLLGTIELEHRREAELAGALNVIGVERHAYLGTPPARATEEPRRYRDSGMTWIREGLAGPADDADPRSLCAADLDEVIADVKAFLIADRAELAVSYADDGGYGHPDHVRMHHATKAAAEQLGIPFAELTPVQDDGVVWFALDRLLPRVAEALGHHRTQLTVHGSSLTHSGGQTEDILTSTGLRGTGFTLPLP
ncbi:glycosyltransferase [Tessaracoccus caeni]|uniref:glycosyltransferase n=1 Tax=Tessaracoccus caeni TaxID=3031239 RepID=UPI0023D9B891|nr:glycosyltransferase [Tessaracoccus caeni]MDF1487201.1 glycosyltransferase [Tessaracoccus caeni]